MGEIIPVKVATELENPKITLAYAGAISSGLTLKKKI